MAKHNLYRGWGKRGAWCTAAVMACAIAGQSASALTMSFNLSSHLDGGERNPLYGLRLDGLDGNSANEFTFDFDRLDKVSTQMMLTFDDVAGTVHIMGQAWGGQDVWHSQASSPTPDLDYYDLNDGFLGVWDIDFTYSANVSVVMDAQFAGSLEVEVTAEDSASNTGTIKMVEDQNGNMIADPAAIGREFSLEDEQGSHSYSFRFNNTDNHRLGNTPFNGDLTKYVGWGWVNHSAGPAAGPGSQNQWEHLYSSDWLFTGMKKPNQAPPPVPEPVTATLAVMGLGVLSLAARRRTMA